MSSDWELPLISTIDGLYICALSSGTCHYVVSPAMDLVYPSCLPHAPIINTRLLNELADTPLISLGAFSLSCESESAVLVRFWSFRVMLKTSWSSTVIHVSEWHSREGKCLLLRYMSRLNRDVLMDDSMSAPLPLVFKHVFCVCFLLQEKEKLYIELKHILARQPGPEAAEKLQVYQRTLREKTKQLKVLCVFSCLN